MVVRIVTAAQPRRMLPMIAAPAAIMGAALLWLASGGHRAAPPVNGVRVIDGAGTVQAPALSPPVIVTKLPPPPRMVTVRRAPKPASVVALAHANGDGQMMGRLAVEQPADRRGSAIEQTVLSTFRAHSLGSAASQAAVTCTITLCEISGIVNGLDPGATRTALRDSQLLSAMAGLGYSTGPDEESAAPTGGTAFVFYFNHVM